MKTTFRTMMISTLAAATAASLLACGNSDDGNGGDQSEPAMVAMDVSGLSPLDEGNYEGWLIDATGEPVSTGKFDVDGSGRLVGENDSARNSNIFETNSKVESPQAFVVSVEPKGDSDASPTQARVLAGEFSNGTADLTVGDDDAIGIDFDGASSSYILSTPTNGEGSNEKSGIWFLTPPDDSAGSPTRGLSNQAPDLSAKAGWTYEGWIVFETSSGNTLPLSAGRFDNPNKADLDDDPYGGPDTSATPGFPGEDFLQNAPTGLSFPSELTGKTVVVSVEPNPDPTEKPFALKPIQGEIPADAESGTAYSADQQGNMPTGTVTLQ